MANLSPQAIQELRQVVNDAMKQPPPAAAAIAPGDFCSIWKTVKPILTVIALLFPPYAGAINALIAIGDKICAG